jgi:hypothetical protein
VATEFIRKVKTISLAMLWLHNAAMLSSRWQDEREKSTTLRYARLTTMAPPIELNEPNTPWLITDGLHRVLAATLRGEVHIEALVMEIVAQEGRRS